MPEFTFPKIDGYEFLAPRNGIYKPFQTIFAAEDNYLHESLNGTYDKYFPLYALTNIQGASTTYRPKINLINSQSTITNLSGDLTPIITKDKFNRREFGRKAEVHPTLGNKNLVLNTVYYREFLSPKILPEYSLVTDKYLTNTIQNKKKQFSVISNQNITQSIEKFKKNSLISYENRYWRCVVETNALPSNNDPNWKVILEFDSIFTADIYAFFGSNLQFLETYTEDRSFRPEQQDTSLVTYNVSCFYG